MSSTGTDTVRSQFFRDGGATISTGAEPARNWATSSRGSTVAESPIRWAGLGSSASSRSRETARCAPRLVPATAWTSSTMMVSTSVRVSRALEVSIRNNDSGVVMRMSGGLLNRERRSAAVVSPDLTPTVISGAGSPSRLAVWVIPIRGERRLRSTSTPRAFSGEMYRTRVLRLGGRGRLPLACTLTGALTVSLTDPSTGTASRPGNSGSGAGSSTISRSRAHRNAASVLPEPVGATTSACEPDEMAFQAPVWAGVGSEKAPRNQSRVGRLKRPMGVPGRASGSAPGGCCSCIPPSCPTPPTVLPAQLEARINPARASGDPWWRVLQGACRRG